MQNYASYPCTSVLQRSSALLMLRKMVRWDSKLLLSFLHSHLRKICCGEVVLHVARVWACSFAVNNVFVLWSGYCVVSSACNRQGWMPIVNCLQHQITYLQRKVNLRPQWDPTSKFWKRNTSINFYRYLPHSSLPEFGRGAYNQVVAPGIIRPLQALNATEYNQDSLDSIAHAVCSWRII